jgi:hypothetical protein
MMAMVDSVGIYKPIVSGGRRIEKARLLRRKMASGAKAPFGGSGGEGGVELFVGCGQFLGFDAGFGYYGHEVGIAGPAREDVEVEVAGDSGAGSAAEVHAEVEALRVINIFEGYLDALGEDHHFGEDFWIGGWQVGSMLVGHDHDVAGGVRKRIKDDEIFDATKNDERLAIIIQGDRGAEDAAFVLRCVGDVPIPPRRPQIIHAASSVDRVRGNRKRPPRGADC